MILAIHMLELEGIQCHEQRRVFSRVEIKDSEDF